MFDDDLLTGAQRITEANKDLEAQGKCLAYGQGKRDSLAHNGAIVSAYDSEFAIQHAKDMERANKGVATAMQCYRQNLRAHLLDVLAYYSEFEKRDEAVQRKMAAGKLGELELQEAQLMDDVRVQMRDIAKDLEARCEQEGVWPVGKPLTLTEILCLGFAMVIAILGSVALVAFLYMSHCATH